MSNPYTHPGSDGRNASVIDLQPGQPLSGTGQLPIDASPVGYEVPFDGVLLFMSTSATGRIRVSNSPSELADVNSMRFSTTIPRYRGIPVRAGQTVSFHATSPGTVQAFMAATIAEVNDFS